MEKTGFENLRIYQLSEEISDSVWGIVYKWDNLSQNTVGKQLVRAADSVGANIAEGSGRGSGSGQSSICENSQGVFI